MKVLFYETSTGRKPVKEALEELEQERPGEHTALMRTYSMVKNLSFEAAVAGQYLKPVRGKVWSLKVWGHQVRLLGCRYGADLIATHIVIKQQDELENSDIETAEQRCRDWRERNE